MSESHVVIAAGEEAPEAVPVKFEGKFESPPAAATPVRVEASERMQLLELARRVALSRDHRLLMEYLRARRAAR